MATAVWSAAGSEYRFRAGGLEGRVDALAPKLALDSCHGQGPVRLELGSVRVRDSQGRDENVPLLASGPYIQEPTLVVPLHLETSAGLEAAARYRGEADGVRIEFRVLTARPVEKLVLEVRCHWETEFRFPLDEGGPAGRRDHDRGAVALAPPAPGEPATTCLLADVGERGGLEVRGSELRYECFGEPLEKGVILVGRFGLVSWPAGLSSGNVRERYRGWRADRTFL